ncbi:predicted protein [Naegleria gruberi]|uniref:Predicted protein n=1 Tax=Naegleria gruberi TaxID=5762 RepID=D2VS56_NAEGR|nr:uncharacterized protein NAEGRDRAFT_71819 [Naegleria gruberi]EFC40368.1 predicted protein [Naegleria gruberi]|eukprot:XP_002673112.1 predicted protein [Naegleria gruberi strain NEG-M]
MHAKIVDQNIHYELVSNGVYPLFPNTAQEHEKHDLLISFILQASSFNESEIITNLKSASDITERGLTSETKSSSYEVKEGETLIFTLESNELPNLQASVFIDKEQKSFSDMKKQIFMGKLEHNQYPVIVKVFRQPTSKLQNFFYSPRFQTSIFLPTVYLDPILKKRSTDTIKDCIMEVSLYGNVLNINQVMENKLDTFKQLLFELHRVHSQHIIHNDIKPSNIVLFDYQGRKTYNFIDFEMARFFVKENGDCTFLSFDTSRSAIIKSKAGTQQYNPPEKLDGGDGCIHPKTDIYSLGQVFIEIIVGRCSMDSIMNLNNIKDRCNEIHPDLFEMLQKMVNSNRKERPTALECLHMLGANIDSFIPNNFSDLFFPKDNNNSLVTIDKKELNLDHQPIIQSDVNLSEQEESSPLSPCCSCNKTVKCANSRCPCFKYNNACTNCTSANCKNNKKRKLKDQGGKKKKK